MPHAPLVPALSSGSHYGYPGQVNFAFAKACTPCRCRCVFPPRSSPSRRPSCSRNPPNYHEPRWWTLHPSEADQSRDEVCRQPPLGVSERAKAKGRGKGLRTGSRLAASNVKPTEGQIKLNSHRVYAVSVAPQLPYALPSFAFSAERFTARRSEVADG